jgi:DNA-directed RNA polymerase subunit M/transcription elongation factor TFIIS
MTTLIIECTKDKPWDHKPGVRVRHVDAHETDKDMDYFAEYRCPNCGHVWKEELPE